MESTSCGLSIVWGQDGNAMGVAPRSENYLLIQFTLAQAQSQIYHVMQECYWACLTLWLSRLDTQFRWGTCCFTVKWVFSLYHSPIGSQEFSFKIRIITFQNRCDFTQKPYGPLLWISYQGFHRVHTVSWSVTGILQTIGLTGHK